jgi:hypothetical protein
MTDGIDEDLQAFHVESLVHHSSAIFKLHGIGETGASATHDSNPQAGGNGVCWPIISFTLVTALAVRVTGAGFLVTSGVATSGTVVVAIGISLALKLVNYNKYRFRLNYQSLLMIQALLRKLFLIWMRMPG